MSDEPRDDATDDRHEPTETGSSGSESAHADRSAQPERAPQAGSSQRAVDVDFAQYADDLRKAERKVAGEIDPGARALVVAVAVLVAMGSLLLPHTGSASGLDVLTSSADAAAERVAVVSKVFVWFLVVFGICGSMLALVTRRWVIAWIALCGCAIGCVAGMLAWWSRNTPGVGGVMPPSGVGAGLIIGWLALLVLTFHWSRVVWARSTYHLALEEERRREAVAREEAARRLQQRPHER